jgi:hypothetical protein
MSYAAFLRISDGDRECVIQLEIDVEPFLNPKQIAHGCALPPDYSDEVLIKLQ